MSRKGICMVCACTEADACDEDAARWLASLLIKQGRSEEAERLPRFGLNPDGSIACA